jgi:hypothetical protein
MTELKARLSDRYDGQNKKTQDELHEALIMDLQEKELAVQRGMELSLDRVYQGFTKLANSIEKNIPQYEYINLNCMKVGIHLLL